MPMKPNTWIKSSRSSSQGECTEARFVPEVNGTAGAVDVRDSKDPDGAVLGFTAAEWTAFVKGVKMGNFDL